MKKVREILKINNATVLVCDLFDDSEITSKIKKAITATQVGSLKTKNTKKAIIRFIIIFAFS